MKQKILVIEDNPNLTRNEKDGSRIRLVPSFMLGNVTFAKIN